MEDNKKATKEFKVSLPTNQIDITSKPSSIDLKEIMNEDCELVLFELPKGFDRENLRNMKIKKFKRKGKQINLNDNFSGICFDENDNITTQNVAMFNNPKKNSVILKPINKYVKVYEIFDIPLPNENNIIKRILRTKDKEENEEDNNTNTKTKSSKKSKK